MIRGAGLQLRVGLSGPFALDFPAVLGLAAAYGADPGLVAELLPEIEPLILAARAGDDPDAENDHG